MSHGHAADARFADRGPQQGAWHLQTLLCTLLDYTETGNAKLGNRRGLGPEGLHTPPLLSGDFSILLDMQEAGTGTDEAGIIYSHNETQNHFVSGHGPQLG